jgi:hypothetical protein
MSKERNPTHAKAERTGSRRRNRAPQHPKAERKQRAAHPTRMQEAEFARAVHVVTADAEHLPQDLERQDYWAHVAQNLRPWTRLEVRADDGTWYAECLVLEAGRNWANVKVLQPSTTSRPPTSPQTQAAIAEEYARLPYEVSFRGEHELWGVIRKSDNAVMHDKEGTKAGADAGCRSA